MNATQCPTCKYFAVPLSKEERANAHCPGANPFGKLEDKVCTLKGKSEFKGETWDPTDCKYYFPIYMRFR
jgi:hypothetical protein